MKIEDLQQLGFNKNEARVYAALAQLGSATAAELIKLTKFHKNIVYDNLEKLLNRGLIAFITENGVRRFQLAPKNALMSMLAEEEKELEQRKSLAKTVERQLHVANAQISRPVAEIYRGTQSIRSFFEDALDRGPYVSFGAPKESVQIMGETFWDNHGVKRAERRLKARMIFNHSLKSFGVARENEYTEIQYSTANFEPLTETHIQQNRVAIIVWSADPVLFLIEEPHVAKAYKIYFENLWNASAK